MLPGVQGCIPHMARSVAGAAPASRLLPVCYREIRFFTNLNLDSAGYIILSGLYGRGIKGITSAVMAEDVGSIPTARLYFFIKNLP